MFIVFEGPEGAGKTTQIGHLARVLRHCEHDVVVTREPGGTLLGERLREILLDGRLVPGPEAEAYLMTAARAEHVRQVIRPALYDRKVVLCDRFVDSTLAYQGAGRGLDIEMLRAMQQLAVGDCWPDLKVLLDVDVAEGITRRTREGDENRLDCETLDFHQRVATWYRREAQASPEDWLIVNAMPDARSVATSIVAAVQSRTDLFECTSVAGPVS